MASPDRSEEPSSNVENESCNSNGGTNPETSSNWIENVMKVRKPYTVSKQREKWSEEEHEKFLEAIKLYGRGWRQIEEHVGTKTAVQIRSHAQKFFSKVAKESDNSNDVSVKAIDIPPPRPKRKPAHPYPRKSPVPIRTEKSPSAMEKGRNSPSPTSVLSAFASEDQINRFSSPNSCTSDRGSNQFIGGSGTPLDRKNDNATSKQPLKEDAAIGSTTPISSITLFGKILLVVEGSRRPDIGHKSVTGQENNYSGIKKSSLRIDSRNVDTDLSLGVWETSCSGSNAFGSVTEASGNLEKNSEPMNRLGSLEKQESFYPVKGFRPYKRCLSEREVTSSLSLVTSDEQNSRRRARVCS